MERDIRFYQKRFLDNEGIRWGIAIKGFSELISTLDFNKIVKGHKVCIGYTFQSNLWGKEYRSEALAAIIYFAFNELSLF